MVFNAPGLWCSVMAALDHYTIHTFLDHCCLHRANTFQLQYYSTVFLQCRALLAVCSPSRTGSYLRAKTLFNVF